MRPIHLVVLGLLLCGCTRPPGTPPPDGGRFLNPLTARPFDPGPDPRASEEAKAVDAASRLVEDGLFDRARTAVDTLLAAGSSHPAVPLLKARLTAQSGAMEDALPWCERAIAASPTWIEPRLLLARLYLQLQRPAAAASVYADIDRLAPWSPWGPYGMGLVAAQRDQEEDAVRHLDEALERDPDHLPSLRARATLAQAAGDTAAEARCLDRALVLRPDEVSLILRLADLAAAQHRHQDIRRHLERAYHLEPRPNIALRLADLARQRGDPAGADTWTARAGRSPAVILTPEPIR